MNPQTLEKDPAKIKPTSQTRRILIRLLKTPNTWVSMPALVECSGSYNVHSRISEIREKLGYKIENKPDHTKGGPTKSYYKIII